MTPHVRELQTMALERVRNDPPKKWRHHGIGVLQLYLTPAHRLHVWHRDLMVSNVSNGGPMHDHRFDIYSTVLAGVLEVSHFRRVRPSDPQAREYSVWSVEGASGGTTSDLQSQGSIFLAEDPAYGVPPGAQHSARRGEFHWARLPTDFHHPCDLAVSSVLRHSMWHHPARILAPMGVRPTHAFETRADTETIRKVLDQAAASLEAELQR